MDTQQAVSELARLINGYQVSQAIHVAASLGIADLLHDGSRSCEDVARATGASPAAMYRLLHALSSVAVLQEDADRGFSLTAIGECLRSDAPRSRVAWARYIGRPYVWQSWGELRQSVLTGETAFRRVHGQGVWEWRAEQPEETAVFDAAMTELSRGAAAALAEAFDFSRFDCVVDVGGGQGALLAGILEKHVRTKGILFDLPHVVARAPRMFEDRGLSNRSAVVAGDMFAGLPPGGDAYVLKSVLMDEDDTKVCEVLRSCRSVIGPSGRLIVIEHLMSEPNKPELVLSDLTMLVMTGGRERSQAEFSTMFSETGFSLEQSIASRSAYTLMIAAPI